MNEYIQKLLTPADFSSCILKNKPLQQNNYLRYMLARTQAMFEYKNLPESIPARELELQLQCFGHVGFVHVDGKLWALRGSFGGKRTPYYFPVEYIIANPWLNLTKHYTIDDDCIVVRNDSMYTGLLPLFLRYSTQLVENDLSMMIAIINSRLINYVIAGDDEGMESAKEYIDGIINGDFGVIGDSNIISGVTVTPSGQLNNNISQLIEAQQYLKAGWFNELGLNANYNMKREAINSDEAQMNHDALFPLVDDMLRSRREGLEKVNEMFGTDISVDFSSVWQVKQEVIEDLEAAADPEADDEPIEIPAEPDEEDSADNEDERTEEDDTEEESK